jgi:beta-lactamase regulating signal transducer with metallopeptidase domain
MGKIMMNQGLWSLLLASSACFAGTWLLAWLLRGRSAAWRHLVWSVGFVLVLVCWALMANSWRLELPWLFGDASVAANVEVSEVVAVDHGVEKPALMARSAARQIDWWRLVWLSGVAVCLSPLAAGWWRVRGLRKCAEAAGTGEELSRLAARIYAGMNRRCRLEVLLSDKAVMPLTGGVFRPFVILPSGAREWSELRQWRVFTHEIGHQVRHDFLWHLFARAVCALCWFNPLAWYAASRQRIEAEVACDDLVLGAGDVAEGYAEDLLQLLREFSQGLDTPLVSSMARQSQIKVRLRSMLNGAADRQPLGWLAKYGMVVGVLLLVFTLSTVRVVHAVGTKTEVSPLAMSASNKQVEISVKFFRISKDANALQSEEFKHGAIGNRDEILKGLKTAEVFSEPKVMVDLGQKVKIRGVGELRYPVEWDKDSDEPPMNFVARDVGSSIECRPVLKDGFIDLELKLETTRVVGFTNAEADNKGSLALTPIFTIISIPSSVSLEDGRSLMLWMPKGVSKLGEVQVSAVTFSAKQAEDEENTQTGVLITARLVDKASVVSVAEKLESIVIPKIDFVDADISEVLNYLQDQSKVNDPLHEGVNIVFKDKPDNGALMGRVVSIRLYNAPVKKILEFLQSATTYKYKLEEHCVYVYPASEINWTMLVRTYPLTVKLSAIIGQVDGDSMQDVTKQLAAQGMEFPQGSEAKYLPKSKKLVVRNTQEQLEKLEELLKE